MKVLFRLLIACFSVGWLLPAWLGVSIYLDFWQVEAWPLLRGEHPLNSAPFIQLSRQSFAVAFAWLTLVVFFWAFRFSAMQAGASCDHSSPAAR